MTDTSTYIPLTVADYLAHIRKQYQYNIVSEQRYKFLFNNYQLQQNVDGYIYVHISEILEIEKHENGKKGWFKKKF